MGVSICRSQLGRALTTVAVAAALAALATACSGATRGPGAKPSSAGPGTTTLHPVGPLYVGDPIPITGYTAEIEGGEHKLVLQVFSPTRQRWSTSATAYVRDGGYAFPSERSVVPGWVKYRTVLYADTGRLLDISNVVTVQVVALPTPPASCAKAPSKSTCPQPTALVEQRTVDVPTCPTLTVSTVTQNRTVGWRWDGAARTWVQEPTAWETVPASENQRPAGVADCVRLVDRVPRAAALPDLRIKDLTRCGKGDADATGGTCFKIVPSAPHDPDFPSLDGRRLLKFPVITLNVGSGPGEIVADRTSDDASDWRAYQTFYDTTGRLLGSVADAAAQFYFAGDGHEHWHVRDFDAYELLDSSGGEVRRAEKHGYCMQDNTTYDPMQGTARVPAQPVYGEDTTCGKGLPKALTIIHGLSRGWGDTYPTSLPDQAVDITGVPDGVYTVRVHADAQGAVIESNEDNNVATVKIRIVGDTVTVLPHSSTGGIP